MIDVGQKTLFINKKVKIVRFLPGNIGNHFVEYGMV